MSFDSLSFSLSRLVYSVRCTVPWYHHDFEMPTKKTTKFIFILPSVRAFEHFDYNKMTTYASIDRYIIIGDTGMSLTFDVQIEFRRRYLTGIGQSHRCFEIFLFIS